jgi:thiol-disulfide isomerase/thioredoxin
MKKILFIISVCCSFLLADAQNPGTINSIETEVVIEGKVTNAESDTWFHIGYQVSNGKYVRDSVKLISGTFKYIGHVEYPTMAYGYFKRPENPNPTSAEQVRRFFIEPGEISIEGNATEINKLFFSGSAVQLEMEALDHQMDDMQDAMKPFSKKYSEDKLQYLNLKKAGKPEEELEKIEVGLDALRDSMAPFQKVIHDRNVAYFKTHPNSWVTLERLKYHIGSMKTDEIKFIYEKMPMTLKATPDGQEIAHEIKKMMAGSPGSMATDFKGTDINGNPIGLADFRGKFVLLDFWASWCGPCRKGNPHLLKLYARYKKNGFEIVGVSDDDSDVDAWHKAVEKDAIGVWRHVLRGLKMGPDGYDHSEDKSDAYGIHTLPTKILIDPNGLIIGRYGDEKEEEYALDNKLIELFGK